MRRLPELIVRPEATARWLQHTLQKPNPPQALLLIGAPGVGKCTIAKTLASAWLCLQRTPDGACGQCESCRKWSAENTHTDLRSLHPTPDQIKIEAVREMRQWMNFAPTVAPFRFVIIEEAHRLNPAAANALLKTLEEPPPRYHFLLTSPASDLLIPTILSRCQIVRLGLLDHSSLYTALLQQGVEPILAEKLTELADGAIGKALRMCETASAETAEWQTLNALLDLFAELGDLPVEGALRFAERFRTLCKQLENTSQEQTSARTALATGLEYLLAWYRDSLALETGRLRFRSYRPALERFASRFSPSQRLQGIEQIAEARRAILGNANAQIVTEALFANLLA